MVRCDLSALSGRGSGVGCVLVLQPRTSYRTSTSRRTLCWTQRKGHTAPMRWLHSTPATRPTAVRGLESGRTQKRSARSTSLCKSSRDWLKPMPSKKKHCYHDRTRHTVTLCEKRHASSVSSPSDRITSRQVMRDESVAFSAPMTKSTIAIMIVTTTMGATRLHRPPRCCMNCDSMPIPRNETMEKARICSGVIASKLCTIKKKTQARSSVRVRAPGQGPSPPTRRAP